MKQPFERLLVGRTLAGRYEVQEVIGAGGMSVVFRALDRTLGRRVAVKVVSLPSELDEAGNLRERFRREAASAARIPPHPNVVQVYDYGTDPELDLDFLVMELLPGRDLKQALLDGGLDFATAMRVLREAARGLAAGHRAGLVHRDVKPANVFLVGEERLESVRLLDFGIAKPMEPDEGDSLTTLGQLPHSPAYASPEQLDPERAVTPSSDVYQLGLIAYELLAGRRPFGEAERVKIGAGERVPLPGTPRWQGVPGPVCRVIEQALQPRPEDRFPDAAAFAEALAHAEDHTQLQQPPVAAIADDGERTVAMPAAAAPPPPPHPAPEPVPIVAGPPPDVAGVPAGAEPAPRPAHRRSPALWIVPLLLLGVLAIWALTRGGGEPEQTAAGDPPPPAAPDTGELAAMEGEFVRLQGQASAEMSVPDEGGGAVPAVSPGTDSVPAASGDDAGETKGGESEQARVARETEAAKEVEDAILDLNEAWVDGDLDRHMSHYADRVDYYAARGATRAFVRADRGRDLRKYDDREMTVRRTAITFPSPDRARALVDKDWRFEGDDERWTGSMRLEMILERRDGDWVVVSEKGNQVYFSRKVPI
jgi:eukaryotic-like serine/threonine-protein kinase